MHARSQVGEGLRITLVDPRHGRGCDRVKELLILGSFPLGLGEYDSVIRIFTCKATPQNGIPPPPYPPVHDRTDSDTDRDRQTDTHTHTPTETDADTDKHTRTFPEGCASYASLAEARAALESSFGMASCATSTALRDVTATSDV